MSKLTTDQGFECPCGDIVPVSDVTSHVDCFMPDTEAIYQCDDCETWYLDPAEARECCV